MDKREVISLNLFFTRGVSLQTWYEMGMYDREVALYRKLQKRGVRVSFITYGDRGDLQFRTDLPGINILCNRWNLNRRIYEKLVPFLHALKLQDANIFKSNQTSGAEIALRAANLWKKPFIARCGFMWSEFLARQNGYYSSEFSHACVIEDEIFSNAEKVVVTTPRMQSDIEKRVKRAKGKTVVIPNYVATDIFVPDSVSVKEFDLIFVGRLTPEKNVNKLLEAVCDLQLNLLVIGKGKLREELQRKYGSMDGRLQWIDKVANNQLPRFLNRSKIFILPSIYEGHPKSLIEAMSCGMAVIGADSPGINEIIKHGENGWLCTTEPESIRSEIQNLLAKPDLCEKLGRNARKFVVKHFSLNRIVEMELNLYDRILGR
jgi:glycosyltransferase involved in cell wall biosynthesis